MFIGHYAVALAAKKASPRTSLGTLFLAAQLVDLLWPVFLLLGLEHVKIDPGNTAFTPLDFYDYPLTHSLAGAAAWSVLLGVLYRLIRKDARGSLVVGACVFSHWVLDFVTHRADLPLWFTGTARVGAGLWNSVPGTLLVEVGIFAAGIAVYLRTTRPRDRTGVFAFWSLVVVLLGIYSANLLGPPPPDPGMIAIAGNAAWLFVLWAYWVDKHRTTEPAVR
jgi:membrane-bound metal-dependent hydrolase YbcI (DUF457 family)